MNIEGKRVILTGAASGIGDALLHRLSGYQATILAVDLEIITGPEDTRATIHTYTGDLSQPETLNKLFDYADEIMGGVDLFIANAGFAYYEALEAPDWSHAERIYQVNVLSPIYATLKMARYTHPYTIVYTVSVMSFLPLAGYTLYSSTKAALNSFIQAYSLEKPNHCHLMAVYPIATRSKFFKRAGEGTPVPTPSQTPAFVAGRIIAGIENNRREVHTSVPFRVFWGISRVMPFLSRLYQSYSTWQFRRWRSRRRL